ncbi:MAG: sigma-70 family RNA polymerase sigma factor [Phycisphaerales bacterium]|nr:MAG: sigma-70 family RNA polymerase sigma factor [Phycisphaerales bacterium]
MEDKLLILAFRGGSTEALCRIYEKYEQTMLSVATALLSDVGAAEDVVHDVFVTLAQAPEKLRLSGSLRGYLTTCVANLARDRLRARRRASRNLEHQRPNAKEASAPLPGILHDEQVRQLTEALEQLPYEQREVLVLHLRGGLPFRAIAKSQNVSINTAQSRYRYGIEKLRAMLNGEVDT